MAVRKYIYWRPDLSKNDQGQMSANVHYLIGYNSCSITAFQEMAAEVRKTFPQATDDQVECGKVHKSSSVNGFSIVTWSGHLPEGEYPGWTQIEHGRMEYNW